MQALEQNPNGAVATQEKTVAYRLPDRLASESADKDLDKLRKALGGEKDLEQAVNIFLRQLKQRHEFGSEDFMDALDKIIAELDRKMSEQVNLILHHPDFQKLEGTWRGLEHLVFATETGTDIKIRVLNAKKEEFGEMFKTYKGTRWDKSPLFQKVFNNEYDMPGGQPFGTLLCSYDFSHKKDDLDILKGMSQVAAAAHAPFIAAAAPEMMDLKSWDKVNEPEQLALTFEGPEWAGWRSFRETLDARYVCLTMPRFLARVPYGEQNKATGWEAFEEDCDGTDHSKYAWSSAAFAMGANITQAFKYYGWTACIRGKNSGGALTGLNVHTFQTASGNSEMKCPTEVAIPGRLEHELAQLGFAAIQHWKNSDQAAFMAAPSVYKPKEFDGDPISEANSRLNGALPYIFVVSRFAHYVEKMFREAIGSFQSATKLQTWMNNWIANYVYPADDPTQDQAAKKPLREAKVTVTEVEGKPGYYKAEFQIKPHYQLEGVHASFQLHSQPMKK